MRLEIYLFDDSGRITADDHIVRYILCDDSTSGNDGIPTDGYAWTDVPDIYEKKIPRQKRYALGFNDFYLLGLKVGVLLGYVLDAWAGLLRIKIVVPHDNRTGIAAMQISQ